VQKKLAVLHSVWLSSGKSEGDFSRATCCVASMEDSIIGELQHRLGSPRLVIVEFLEMGGVRVTEHLKISVVIVDPLQVRVGDFSLELLGSRQQALFDSA
jgi:hypothetical protein